MARMTVSSAHGLVDRPLAHRPATLLIRALTLLAVAGFVIPNAMVVTYLARHGLGSTGDYFAAWTASLPSTQLAVDLLLCSLAFFAWSFVDARRLGVRWWVVVPATFLVGLCFGIPLYLLLRERRLAARPEPLQGGTHA